MCGIAGIWNFRTGSPPDRERLERMTRTMLHRGPDDEGFHVESENSLGLGFRRLSIIDLSPAGHQPMANEDGTLWLVCNGEIYNFRALRQDLETRGHVFRSATDIETIIHAYEEWDLDAVRRLDGMFSFALWDSTRRRLLLCRDRFGIKPLFVAQTPSGIAFASELKAFMEGQDSRPELNNHAIWNFLTFGQIPSPETVYQGVEKLLPGHILTCEKGSVKVSRYYEIATDGCQDADANTIAERVGHLLSEAIKTHMVADVRVGCFLSGGLDSSLIAALAAKNVPRLSTFSVSFPGSGDEDEAPYQRMVADHLGTDHHTIAADVSLDTALPDMLRATDEPFAISSFLPLLCVSKLAASTVKVVLSGDGSDELFAGYGARYTEDGRRLWFRHLAPFTPGLSGPDDIWENNRWRNKVRRRAHLAAMAERDRYIHSTSYFTPREKNALLQHDFLAMVFKGNGDYVDRAFDGRIPDPVRRRMKYELQTCLHDEMLTKVDRATSATSIEGRVPFLDKALAEYAWGIPTHLMWSHGAGKQILKRAARGLVPQAVIERPKAGFNVPLALWLTQNDRFMRPTLLEPNERFDSIIRPGAVRRMILAHDSGLGNHAARLWILYVLKSWMNEHK